MIDILNDIEDKMSEEGMNVPIITEIRTSLKREGVEDRDLDNLPIMAMRNVVLFPGTTIPIAVGREKSLKLIKDAQRSGSLIGVVCQTDSKNDDPGVKELYRIGTVVEVLKVLTMPDDTINVILHGHSTFMLDEVLATEPYLRCRVKEVPEMLPKKGDKEFAMLMSSIKELTLDMLGKMSQGGREMSFALKNIDNYLQMINFVAGNVPFDAHKKQMLLEESDIKKRAYHLYSILSKEAQLLDLKESIQSRTREDLSQQQREHFLQQQLRTIQEELGNEGNDSETLREKAQDMKWNETTQAYFDKELKKLDRLNPQSPDYSTQFSFLDTMLSLPWLNYSPDNFNLAKVEAKLNHDHFGLENVKERILEHLAVLKLRGDLKAPILCLYGPPGVGKTSFGRSVAEALGREYARISLGGLHDEAEIRGHRRTYIGAMPGRVIDAIMKCKTSNPVIVLDEIDKVGQDYKGDPSSALLEVLDPEQNSKFHDNYIDVDYDLSKVLFIATANTLTTISKPLLDRMELIEINGYIHDEKVEIAKRHLVPKQLEENGFGAHEVTFTKKALLKIIDNYTRESGVRELEKKISKVLRKLAPLKASGKAFDKKITPEAVGEMLGAEEFTRESYEGNEFAGVVTGLAWTATGGDILYIESALTRGKGEKLTLTGNLGEVMKESAMIALQYVKSHSCQFGIDDGLFDKYNVHIHVPEGAIPKDGPSAGVTMATSLVSTFTQRQLRPNVAMTGEITLRGKVLPVGGIKEKILAAKRAGITDIVLCEKNKKDIEEIKANYLKGLNFHYVNTIGDVIDYAVLAQQVPNALTL